MSITELLKNADGANITVAIRLDDLRSWHNEIIESKLCQIEQTSAEKSEDDLLLLIPYTNVTTKQDILIPLVYVNSLFPVKPLNDVMIRKCNTLPIKILPVGWRFLLVNLEGLVLYFHIMKAKFV